MNVRSTPQVGLVDYGSGNIQSLSNAIEHIGARVHLVRDARQLSQVSHMVLPGVGAFGFCADRLRESGLLPAIEEWALTQHRPILGICVGMQLLADSSDELGFQVGLGWVGGTVTKLERTEAAIRIPHVGWNTARFDEDFGDFRAGTSADFYFDHSFAYQAPSHGHALASCTHGRRFCAAVRRENIVGVQFHPEKSQRSGMQLLRGFVAM